MTKPCRTYVPRPPPAAPLQRGKLLGHVDLGFRFEVSFDLNRRWEGVGSVLHLTDADDQSDHNPAFFLDGSGNIFGSDGGYANDMGRNLKVRTHPYNTTASNDHPSRCGTYRRSETILQNAIQRVRPQTSTTSRLIETTWDHIRLLCNQPRECQIFVNQPRQPAADTGMANGPAPCCSKLPCKVHYPIGARTPGVQVNDTKVYASSPWYAAVP